uniref:Uncharacterized protein n=1 Tax=viral metagenome TaxID=1070528 RepID=A0A6C0BXR2_9ZZZZ
MKYLDELVKVNSVLNEKIFKLERELIKTRAEIKKNNNILWNSCDHEWVDQQDSSMYEKSTYRCSKCNLINDHRLYTIRR